MTQNPDTGRRPSRQEVSDAVGALGWRYVLGAVCASVPVASLARSAEVAARVVATAGDDGEGSLRLDVRRDRVVLTLQSFAVGRVTPFEIELAGRISATVGELGLRTDPGVDARGRGRCRSSRSRSTRSTSPRSARSGRRCWATSTSPARRADEDPLVDPVGQGPAIWFQQMDAPRPQRNRIHFDVSVPHDEAPRRIAAALAAGGSAAVTTPRRPPSGCWPTPRATRRA